MAGGPVDRDAHDVLRDLYPDKTPENISRHENVQALLNGLKEFSVADQNEAPKTLNEFIGLKTTDNS